MSWYKWTSVEEFEEYHSLIKEKLNIPYPGRNLETNQIDVDAQWTIKYTEVYTLAVDDHRAFIEDYVVELVSNLLGEESTAPVFIDEA